MLKDKHIEQHITSAIRLFSGTTTKGRISWITLWLVARSGLITVMAKPINSPLFSV